MTDLLNLEDEYIPPYTPPKYRKQNTESLEENMGELNNLGRVGMTKDFSDSPHLDK